MIFDYLPTYHQIENNSLKGLLPGFVVSQVRPAVTYTEQGAVDTFPAFMQEKNNKIGSTSTAYTNLIANGHVVAISANGIKDAEATDKTLFIVFSEPLNRVMDNLSWKYYATDVNEEELRLVQLIPGDEWMSDMDLLAGENNPLAGRIVKIDNTVGQYKQDEKWYAVNQLADGTQAYHYMFLG
jgi:hypothetical protein